MLTSGDWFIWRRVLCNRFTHSEDCCLCFLSFWAGAFSTPAVLTRWTATEAVHNPVISPFKPAVFLRQAATEPSPKPAMFPRRAAAEPSPKPAVSTGSHVSVTVNVLRLWFVPTVIARIPVSWGQHVRRVRSRIAGEGANLAKAAMCPRCQSTWRVFCCWPARVLFFIAVVS